MNTEKLGPVEFLLLESAVYGDSAYIADLVLNGQTDDADAYCRRDDVAARILLWKANR